MIRAVYDTNLLVSAFLSRDNPGGVSSELLQLGKEGAVELYLSAEIVAETLATLVSSERARRRYDYTPRMAIEYCAELLAAPMIIIDPPPSRATPMMTRSSPVRLQPALNTWSAATATCLR
jgi:predicted nucleic acid-binding protein